MPDESLVDAFERLGERARHHLPLLGLFAAHVHAGLIAQFVAGWSVEQETYREVLDGAGWSEVLEEAAAAGLLQRMGGPVYGLPPALGAYLRDRLVEAVGEQGLAHLDREFLRYHAIGVGRLYERMRRGEQDAVLAAQWEETNLQRALRLAEAGEEWRLAAPIVQTLVTLYRLQGRTDELRALRAHLLDWVGREVPSDADRTRFGLWMFLQGEEANEALAANDPDRAEGAYRPVLDRLLALDEPAVEPQVAALYHILGSIAHMRGQPGQAEGRYREALAIWERLGRESNAAEECYHLGTLAEGRRQIAEAEGWYRRAVEICERLGLEREAPAAYHRLGNIDQQRGQLDRAEDWYRKALAIRERLGLEQEAAEDYAQMGNLAYRREQLDAAEGWYRKALAIWERPGLEPAAALIYHQLGALAQDRKQYPAAEDWYRKALAIEERLDYPPRQVDTLAALGALYGNQNRLAESVAWSGRALYIAGQYRMPGAGTILYNLGLVLKAMGEEAFRAAWGQAFTEEPPMEALREMVKQIR